MENAPLFNDLAEGPEGGRAFWVTARDGVRLRLAVWPAGPRGSVLMLPGRTEFVEKYGRAAREFAARGFGLITLDWRGQGLANRPAGKPMLGHVDDFLMYQWDLQAVLNALDELKIAQPQHLVSHSMGGCIALRALMGGLTVKAAVFSAPMWDIEFGQFGGVVRGLAHGGTKIGLGMQFAPGTSALTYVTEHAFANNLLTRDAPTYAWLQAQARAQPGLTLGGPSMRWLDCALRECSDLARLSSPDVPALCVLGGGERVVAAQAIHARMKRWPKARLEVIAGAEHEIMMEVPASRTRFYDLAVALFDAHP
jgi:lysophospholipase